MTILPPIYGFSEQLRRMADQISCTCKIHLQIRASLYHIAQVAEDNPATILHMSKERMKAKRQKQL